ncbi:MAG: helix-turn-helix domain-containing protein, partial [Pseudomonadota bacterium]|nr:helix-turn-helix domain-containing protein [Pseudomonadota bacterium]
RQKQLMHQPSGKTADVTDKEARLLQVLAGSGKNGVAKEKLLKEVWGIEATLNTHTLETHVYRLRAKFRELAGNEIIAAINGGYGLKK